MVVFVTLFATIEVQQCKKRSKFLLDFCFEIRDN